MPFESLPATGYGPYYVAVRDTETLRLVATLDGDSKESASAAARWLIQKLDLCPRSNSVLDFLQD